MNVLSIINSVLTEQFNVLPQQLNSHVPLEHICPKLSYLNNLMEFENELSKELKRDVCLVENVNASFHSIQDVVELVSLLTNHK